jgi:serine/threonine-protein kinase
LFPAAGDSARDYVLLAGTSSSDAPTYTEKAEEAGANPAPAASVKPGPSPSAPHTDPQPLASSILPLSSPVETGTGAKENLDLKTIEKHLAVSLGPIARFIVEKAAAKAKNRDELFAQIASTISSPHDREVFLSKRKQFVCTAPPEVQTPKAAAAGAGPSTDTSVPRTGSVLNPADIGKAAELAARYLGPISRVLAERAARHADSLRGLYEILAGHLKENERAQFLHDAGYPES